MIIKLGESQNALKSENKISKLDYNLYIDACYKIADDIRKNYKKIEDIELIGLARGGLPLLVTISHLLNIRSVSIIQTQMSNSDNMHDYGKFRYLSDTIDKSKKRCILLEDIVYKGVTYNGVIDIIKERFPNKEILGTYSLIMDKGYKKIENRNQEIELKYVYDLMEDEWVYFLWETDIRKI
jgi:hypoxanthine-guanine phosphoribosyltransferase